MIQKLLKLWALYGIAAVAALAIGYLGLQNYRLRAAQAAVEKAKDAAFADQAKELGFVKAQKASAEQIAEALNRETLDLGMEIQRLRAKDRSIVPVLAGKATVSVSDSVGGRVEGPTAPSSYCPEALVDEYGRFHVSVPRSESEKPIFKRDQLFSLDVVAIRRLTGDFEFGKAEFREFRPGVEPSSDTEIPIHGAVTHFHFQVLEEVPPSVKPLHPRAVLLVDHRLAVGGGIELFNFKDKANLTLAGVYDRKTSRADGVVHLGYRLGKTNLSLGPYFALISKSFGAAVSLELTR